MLDEPQLSHLALQERYGDVLPDTLIGRAIEVAPTAEMAQADVAALAEAVARAAMTTHP